MTTLTDIPAAEAPADIRAEIERASHVDGLRALADALEAHPEIPLPYHGHGSRLTIMFLDLDGSDGADMAAAARAIPCEWRKRVSGGTDESPGYFDLDGDLHGLKLTLTTFRDIVCKRVVTGTREVTEEVPDPEALAAVPKVAVTKIIEDVTWECGSVLALAAKDEGRAA